MENTHIDPEGMVEKARAWSDTADLSVVITTGSIRLDSRGEGRLY